MRDLTSEQQQENGINFLNDRFPGKLSREGEGWVFNGTILLGPKDDEAAHDTDWRFPDNLTVTGRVDISGQNNCVGLGKNLQTQVLDIGNCGWISKIEDGSKIGRLVIDQSAIDEIGDNVSINGDTTLNQDTKKIGKNFTINGDLTVNGADNLELSSGLDVKRHLDLTNTTTIVPDGKMLMGNYEDDNGTDLVALPVPADAKIGGLVFMSDEHNNEFKVEPVKAPSNAFGDLSKKTVQAPLPKRAAYSL